MGGEFGGREVEGAVEMEEKGMLGGWIVGRRFGWG